MTQGWSQDGLFPDVRVGERRPAPRPAIVAMPEPKWWKVWIGDAGYLWEHETTRGRAKYSYLCEAGGACDSFTDVETKRYSYLDGWCDDPEGPDALMARLRHGDLVDDEHHGHPAGESFLATLGHPVDCGSKGYDDEWGRFDSSMLTNETEYEAYAEWIGATYPDRYKPEDES